MLLLLLQERGLLERVGAALPAAALERGLFSSGRLMTSSRMSLCQMHSAEADAERDDRDDEPRAQLVEVLDEAQPVFVRDRLELRGHRGEAAAVRRAQRRSRTTSPSSGSPCGRVVRRLGPAERGVGARAGVGRSRPASSARSSSLSLPVIESLNSRMPDPSCRPSPGSRFGPKINRTMTRTMPSSRGPMPWIRRCSRSVGLTQCSGCADQVASMAGQRGQVCARATDEWGVPPNRDHEPA